MVSVWGGEMNGGSRALPAYFISHGAPDVLLRDPWVFERWIELGMTTPRPKGILVISAHWESDDFCVSANARTETIHDFWGFPPSCITIVMMRRPQLNLPL